MLKPLEPNILTNVLFVEGKNFNLVENFIFMCQLKVELAKMENEKWITKTRSFDFRLWSLISGQLMKALCSMSRAQSRTFFITLYNYKSKQQFHMTYQICATAVVKSKIQEWLRTCQIKDNSSHLKRKFKRIRQFQSTIKTWSFIIILQHHLIDSQGIPGNWSEGFDTLLIPQ